METFNDTSTVLQTAITQFDSLVQQIPPEMEYDVLRSLLASFDQLAAVLPKWVGAEYAAYRSLLLMRIGLYDEYQKIAGIAAAGSRPHLEAVEYRSAVEDANLRRASRVSSLMGIKMSSSHFEKQSPLSIPRSLRCCWTPRAYPSSTECATAPLGTSLPPCYVGN